MKLDDKKVLEEGRSSTLKGVDAPLRERIDQKLYDKLVEMNIGEHVSDQWSTGNAHRSLWLERQQVYLSSWDEHLVPDTDGPFAGSSQLHIPITFVVCKALHARFLQALWQDPPFNCRAQNEASIERVPAVRDTLRYYLMKGANYHKGIGPVVDKWVWKWVTTGAGLMKLRWDVTYTRFTDVRTVKKPGSPVVQTVNGQEQVVKPLVDVEEEFENVKKCFDGPVFTTIDPEDLLLIGGAGDPDDADEVHHRDYLTASQLWTLVDRKVFKEDAVKKVIEGGRNYKGGAIGNDIKEQAAVNAGKGSLDHEAERDRYEIIESYMKVDVDGSGIAADVIVWSHLKSKEILHATYLYRASKAGERPFVKADFHRRDGQEYGIGIPELMYPLAQELDAMHNMRIDFGLISVMPFGFYRATSSLDPKTIKFEPGSLIPVDDPQSDVYFPNLGNRSSFGFQEEQALDTMIQRLTGINDLSMGMMQGQGATRTATGARAVVGEMSANLDVHLRRLNWGWEKALRCSLHMLQQRIPPGTSFRLTGDDGKDYWRYIKSQDDIAGDFDIEVSPNSASSNAGIQQEMADGVLQLASNPLAIQLGIITPAQYYEAMKNKLQAMGVKDWGRYVQKPQGYERVLSPEEEGNRLLRGMDVPILPNSDHEGFIKWFQYVHDNDELLGQFNEEQTIILAAHAKKHEQMAAALKAQQAQQANVNQMRQNAAMSQNQAPVAMNPMAGSQQGAPIAPTQ